MEGEDAEVFVARQLMENVAGGGDGVGAVKERQAAQLAGRNEPGGQGLVARDVPVGPRLEDGLADLVRGGENLRRFAKVVTDPQRPAVGLDDVTLASEFLLDPLEGRLQGAIIHPVHEAQGEKVLGPIHRGHRQAHVLQCDLHHPGDVDRNDLVFI